MMALRTKSYLVILSATLWLLVWSVYKAYPVIVEPEAALGLGSYLPLTYWLGLGSLVICAIFVYFDNNLKGHSLYWLILIILALYIVGISLFVRELPRAPEAYFPTSIGQEIIASGHLNMGDALTWKDYWPWPTTQFLSASLVGVTSVPILFIIKYTPLFWAFIFIMALFALGSRHNLSGRDCFAVAFLGLSSWIQHQDFSPQGIAFLFYLIFLLLITDFLVTRSKKILEWIVFGVIILTNAITSVAILLAYIMASIYRYRTKRAGLISIIVLLLLFLMWYLNVAVPPLEHGIRTSIASPFSGIMDFLRPGRFEQASAAPAARSFARTSQLSFVAIYIILFVISSIAFFRKWRMGERRSSHTFWYFWLAGIGIILLLGFNESQMRIYHLSLPVILIIIMLNLPYRRVIVPIVMMLFVIFQMPAHYGGDTNWGQVLRTEFQGSQFFVERAQPKHQYFYNYSGFLLLYYDSNLMKVSYVNADWIFPGLELAKSQIFPETRYVILSKQASDRMISSWGIDPYANWPNTEQGKTASLVYNNSAFNIYRNE